MLDGRGPVIVRHLAVAQGDGRRRRCGTSILPAKQEHCLVWHVPVDEHLALRFQDGILFIDDLRAFEERLRPGLLAHAAGYQIMLQRPGDPPSDNPVALHSMVTVRGALELSAYPQDQGFL